MNLANKKCVPCQVWMPPLTKVEAQKLLKKLKNWQVVKEKKVLKIRKSFQFQDFLQSMAFVNKVAQLAEKEGHHPDFCLFSWNNVSVSTYTHKIKGLHENDFILAAKIDKIKV